MNKKGFTMVELLGTMVILAIISTVGIIAITNVLDSGRKNHYNTLLKNIRVAGESYYADRKLYPKIIGQKSEVKVAELVSAKYIDSVKDSNDKECDYEKSKVTAYKTASSSYKYFATLVCENYDNSKEAIESNLNINITLTKDMYDTTDKFNIEDQEGGISSYRYRIYKNSVLLYDSGVIDSKGIASEEVALNYKSQTNNGSNIRVVVNATDIYGNTVKKSKSVVIENSLAPICGKSIKGASTTWLKGSRTVSINCKSNNNTKCKQSRYSQTFSATTKTGYITIEGDNGVNSECAVDVYVDNKAPSCTISPDTTDKTKSVVLTINGSDSDSGIATKGYSWTSATTGFGSTRTQTVSKNGTYTGYVKDNAGNTAKCSREVTNIYKKPATPTITNPTGGNWVNKDVSLTVKTTTAAEELGYWYYSYDNSSFTRYDESHAKKSYTTPAFSDELNSTVYIRVCNKGASGPKDTENCSDSASTTVRIDKTKPTITASFVDDTDFLPYTPGTWARHGLYRTLHPNDSGGSGLKKTEYNAGYDWQPENNTGSYWLDQRNETVSFRTTDNAGNISDILELHIMIDWTPPNSPAFNNVTITNGKVDISNCEGVGGIQGNVSCTVNLSPYEYDLRYTEYLEFSDNLSGFNRKQYKWDHNGGGNKCLGWVDDCSPFSATGGGPRAQNIWAYTRAVDNAGNPGYEIKITYNINWP